MKKGLKKVIGGLSCAVLIGTAMFNSGSLGINRSNAEEINSHTKKNKTKLDSKATTGKLKVSYLLVNDKNKKIKPSVMLTEDIGVPYQLSLEKIDGYEFIGLSENSAPSTGFYSNGTKNVTYLYKRNNKKTSSKKGKLKIRYVTETGVDIISPKILSEKIGTRYKVKKVKFKGYAYKGLSEKSASVEGKYKKGTTEVCFEYKDKVPTKNPDVGLRKLVIRYVDKNGNNLRQEEENMGQMGSHYEVKQVSFPGYNLLGLARSSAPASGEYSKGTTIVTYVYDNQKV